MDVVAWRVKIENDRARQVFLVRHSVSGIDTADSDTEMDPDAADSVEICDDLNAEPVNLTDDELMDRFEIVVIV